MRVVFDTNILIAANVSMHPHYQRAKSATAKHFTNIPDQCFISTHTLLELYCNLTRLPVNPRISPATAIKMIESDVLKYCSPLALNDTEIVGLMKTIALLGIKGAATYDALICACAEKAGADILYTFNPRDFLRVWPAGAGKIHEP